MLDHRDQHAEAAPSHAHRYRIVASFPVIAGLTAALHIASLSFTSLAITINRNQLGPYFAELIGEDHDGIVLVVPARDRVLKPAFILREFVVEHAFTGSIESAREVHSFADVEAEPNEVVTIHHYSL
ncbi:hypothetical protein [Brevibacterium casei]|uniref:hypothetical protein n=1 Tax=Brevibacterium casei TaxID=33889 RepID=UPI00167F1BB1|nr:hypothetical protein [Brevibacterium casei]